MRDPYCPGCPATNKRESNHAQAEEGAADPLFEEGEALVKEEERELWLRLFHSICTLHSTLYSYQGTTACLEHTDLAFKHLTERFPLLPEDPSGGEFR